MSSVDCAAFNSFNPEVCLAPSLQAPAPETENPCDQTTTPTVVPNESSKFQDQPEILVPGKNWEYIAEYPLNILKVHPLQIELFAGIDRAGIRELGNDIQKRGLQNPIEILSDSTIVNGHQRVYACMLLHWEHIPVYIRHDFANQPETAVHEHIIQDNLQRKNLHPLEIAKCYQHLRAVFAAQQEQEANDFYTAKDLRDDLARRFKISNRTLDRYAAALKAPPLIQGACINGHLPMELVSKIGSLSHKKIMAMMKRIEAGEHLPTVVREFAQRRKAEPDRSVKALVMLTRQLARGMTELEEKLDKLPYTWREIQDCRPVWEKVQGFTTKLLECYQNPPVNEAEEAKRAKEEEIVAGPKEHLAHKP